MVNYDYGKVYKIEPVSGGEVGDIYIGSTTKTLLSQRMAEHRIQFKRWENGKGNKTTSYILFEKYGVLNCNIVLLESVECTSKDELRARESHYIRTLKCVNRYIPGNDNIVKRMAEFREQNRDAISKYQADYREAKNEALKALQTI